MSDLDRGINYDLEACLDHNPQTFRAVDIHKVLAVQEGKRDEAGWTWILELCDDKYVYLTGSCDYTGWD